MMKQILITALLIVAVGFLILYIYFRLEDSRYRRSHSCGGWSLFGGIADNPPTCECDGTIVRRGGPSKWLAWFGMEDDSGGWYECVGTIRSRVNTNNKEL